MGTVTVRFTDGPADGAVHDLPAGPDGAPPPRWVLTGSDDAPGAGPDHLYERGPRPSDGAPWTMRWIRSDPVGMTE